MGGRVALRALWCQAAAMLVAPARRCALIAVLRRLAMTHGAWPTGADMGGILGIGDIAYPVKAVLDLPAPADPAGQLLGSGRV